MPKQMVMRPIVAKLKPVFAELLKQGVLVKSEHDYLLASAVRLSDLQVPLRNVRSVMNLAMAQIPAGGLMALVQQYQIKRAQDQALSPAMKVNDCKACKGFGMVRAVQESFFGPIVNVQKCPKCKGKKK